MCPPTDSAESPLPPPPRSLPPWARPLHDDARVGVQFEDAHYQIQLSTERDRLVWSVPAEQAALHGVPAAYESGVERFALDGGVELWSFPKQRPTEYRHVLLYLRAGDSAALSTELAISDGPRARSRVLLLRGQIDSGSPVETLVPFPRRRPVERRWELKTEGGPVRVKFGASGELVSIARAGGPAHRAVGMVIDLTDGLVMVEWRSAGACGALLLRDGFCLGYTLVAGETEVTSYCGTYDIESNQ